MCQKTRCPAACCVLALVDRASATRVSARGIATAGHSPSHTRGLAAAATSAGVEFAKLDLELCGKPVQAVRLQSGEEKGSALVSLHNLHGTCSLQATGGDGPQGGTRRAAASAPLPLQRCGGCPRKQRGPARAGQGRRVGGSGRNIHGATCYTAACGMQAAPGAAPHAADVPARRLPPAGRWRRTAPPAARVTSSRARSD